MNNNLEKRLKLINIENNIWIIYIGIIILSFYSNVLEKDYFINKNISSKNKYQKINTIIFITLIIVYSFFENESIKSLKNINKSKYDNLNFIATTLVLISGLIFLYIILNDNDLEEEIAFN